MQVFKNLFYLHGRI